MYRDSDRERRNMMGICGISSRILTLAALALSLAGCGGGSSTNTTGVTLSVTPLNISVSAISTQSAPTPSFVVNFSSQHQIGQVFVGIAVGGKGIDQVVNNGGQLPVTIPIELLRPSSLGPGTYDGTVKVSGCLDNACAQPVADSPQTIHVQYTVTLSPLIVSGFSPTTAYVGGAAFSLAVSGSSFTSQSTVLWNGAQLATSYVDSTTLSAKVPASDLAKAGNVAISISDPTYGISA